MGAVAIMKAIKDYDLKPKGIIIECPFGTMQQTVEARFKNMNVPTFPMTGLLVFWGGLQHGFWAFHHNPTDYAKQVTCPTLLLFVRVADPKGKRGAFYLKHDIMEKRVVKQPNSLFEQIKHLDENGNEFW